MYHKSCYVQRRRETGRAELTPETEDYSISPKKTRSVTQLSFDVSLCVFCQVKSSKAKGSLIAFCTDRAQASVDAAILNSTDMVMKGRLAGVDLTAYEVKYHKPCYLAFLRTSPVHAGRNPQESNETPRTHQQDAFQLTYNHFKRQWNSGQAVSVHTVAEYCNNLLDVKRESRSITRSITSRYPHDIQLIDLGPSEKLLVSKKFTLLELINKVREQEQCVRKLEDTRIQSVAEDILEDIKLKWHPVDSFNITQESISGLIPQSLQNFIDGLSESGKLCRKQSIALDIIALCLKRIPPTHLTLANSIKHLTGSKELIEQLNAMGHCCSYTELMRFETAAAETEIAYGKEHGVVIPPIIQEADKGFLQASADNDDFQEETIDGRNTTHGTTMVLIQHVGDFNPTFKRTERRR